LLAVGGSNPFLAFETSSVLDRAEEYDPTTDTWSTRARIPTRRIAFGLAAASNGKVYVIGGYSPASSTGVSIIVNTVEEYDPTTDTWTVRASMPTGRCCLGAVAANNGKIYAIAGHRTVAVSTVEEYDPTTDTWSTRASLPAARADVAAALGANGKIYVFGGHRNTQVAFDSVFEYDPTTDTWATKTPMPTPRSSLAAAAVNSGKIYAIGGIATNTGQQLATVEEYDSITDTWSTMAGMSTAREKLGAATATNGKIYAVGGADTGGRWLSLNEEATISSAAVNQPPPITSFTATPSSGILPSSGAGVPVTFTVVASDPDGTIVQAQWDFVGNGTVDRITTALTTSFTYTTANTFHPSVTVMDNDGAMASAATAVMIETPIQAINDLTTNVQGLPLNAGQKNSLMSKLNATSDAINRGNLNAACNQLGAFINEVNALVQSQRLDQATELAGGTGASGFRGCWPMSGPVGALPAL
jgi:N-acetylneuraminic acid mutarotase